MNHRTVRGGRDRGVVLPMFALFITTIILMVSFAVDLGRLRAERRDVQADADAIALDAVQAIKGLKADAALPVAIAEANASAQRNDFPATLTASEVSVGTWNVQTQQLCTTGTVVNGVCQTAGAGGFFPDAVQIDLSSTIPMFFDFSADERSVQRTAVAVARAQTMGELGSVTAGIEPKNPFAGCAIGAAASAQMTFMNYLYTELLGIEAEVRNEGEIDESVDETISCDPVGPDGGLKLDVGSYQGIAASRVNLRDLAFAMGFGSTEELLASNVSQKDVLEGSATALQQSGNTADAQTAAMFTKIAAQADGSSEFRFGDAFTVSEDPAVDYDPPVDAQGAAGNGQSAAEASVNALDMLVTTATAINGKNFIGAENDFFLPGAAAGLADIRSRIHVIEGPQRDGDWRSPGQRGPKTSQVHLALDVPVSFSNTALDLTDLGLPGITATGSITGTGSIPIVIRVGTARSDYPNIQCGPEGIADSVVTWRVNTAAVRGSIGVLADGQFNEDAVAQSPTSPLINGTATLSVKVGLVTIPVTLDFGQLTTPPALTETFAAGSDLNVGNNYNVSAGGAVETVDFASPYPTEPPYRFKGGIYGLSMADSLVASHTWGTAATGTLGTLLTGGQSGIIRDRAIKGALRPVMKQVDEFVTGPLLEALGVTAGGADGRILNVRCQVPALANRG